MPLLYLGDLFERGEIRDLLSLVALDAEFGGLGLVRVGQLPAYGATERDTREVKLFRVHSRTLDTGHSSDMNGRPKLGSQKRVANDRIWVILPIAGRLTFNGRESKGPVRERQLFVKNRRLASRFGMTASSHFTSLSAGLRGSSGA